MDRLPRLMKHLERSDVRIGKNVKAWCLSGEEALYTTLTQEQRKSYDDNEYVVVQGLLNQNECNILNRRSNQKILDFVDGFVGKDIRGLNGMDVSRPSDTCSLSSRHPLQCSTGNSIADAISKLNRRSKIDAAAFTSFLNELARALLASDVNFSLIQQLKTNIERTVNIKDLPNTLNVRRVIEKAVIEELTHLLGSPTPPRAPKRNRSNVFMFVGLQGSGKTTTCTKLAYYYRTRGWKVGLVCADTFRAGAFDQLRQNATKAKIPYFGKRDETDPVKVATEGVNVFKQKSFEIIIVDTSGRHKQEDSLFEEMEAISRAVNPNQTIFVLDSTIGQAASAQAIAFKERVNVGSVILTKMDGHARGGGALSAVANTGAPITFIGVGEHMNELEKFHTKRFIGRILGKGDMATMMERVQETDIQMDDAEFLKKIKKGTFTMSMMREQFGTLLQLGSGNFSGIFEMMPGINVPKESQGVTNKRVQAIMIMMDSMTEDELESRDIVHLFKNDESRCKRICQGSGMEWTQFGEMMQMYNAMATMMGKLGKVEFGKDGSLPSNDKEMRKMANAMPHQFVGQCGGQKGFIKMMRDMEEEEQRVGQEMGREMLRDLNEMKGDSNGNGRRANQRKRNAKRRLRQRN